MKRVLEALDLTCLVEEGLLLVALCGVMAALAPGLPF